jgi:hypothetical protein
VLESRSPRRCTASTSPPAPRAGRAPTTSGRPTRRCATPSANSRSKRNAPRSATAGRRRSPRRGSAGTRTDTRACARRRRSRSSARGAPGCADRSPRSVRAGAPSTSTPRRARDARCLSPAWRCGRGWRDRRLTVGPAGPGRGRRSTCDEAEFGQLTADPTMAPARILASQPQHQGPHLGRRRRPSAVAGRLPPLPSHERPMPAQQRPRADQTRSARGAWQMTGRRREQGTIRGAKPRTRDLPAQHLKLVAHD